MWSAELSYLSLLHTSTVRRVISATRVGKPLALPASDSHYPLLCVWSTERSRLATFNAIGRVLFAARVSTPSSCRGHPPSSLFSHVGAQNLGVLLRFHLIRRPSVATRVHTHTHVNDYSAKPSRGKRDQGGFRTFDFDSRRQRK